VQNPTAVLIVDAQTGLLSGDTPVHEADALVDRIKEVIDRAREAGVAVIYVQDDDVGPVGSEPWQIHPAIAPLPSEPVFRKAFSDAFYQTELHDELAARGVADLVVLGCKTDACVAMTCRRAVALGYNVTLVSDGHSTTDNRFMAAEQSIAYYNIILDGFGAEDGFGGGQREILVRPTDEITFHQN
jgi:nicotinamidase-related amidase